MKDWFWYIAARRHRHRRAHRHLHRLRLHLRALRLARPALQEDDLQAGVGPLPELGLHVADGPRPHPLLARHLLHLAVPRHAAAPADHRHLPGRPRVHQGVRAAGLVQPARRSGRGVAALSLNYGAYLTEVFRAGIQAVPKGQNEAAWAIGLSGWQTQRRIVLPQAFKIVIPAVGNDFIALIKDTSLVSVITVEELLRRSQLAGAATLTASQHAARGGRLLLGADDLLQLLAGQARDAHGARQGPREGEGEGDMATTNATLNSPITTTRAASSSSRSRACRSTSARTTCSRASTSRCTRARWWCSSGRPARARAPSCAASTSSRTPRPARSASAACTSPAAATAAVQEGRPPDPHEVRHGLPGVQPLPAQGRHRERHRGPDPGQGREEGRGHREGARAAHQGGPGRAHGLLPQPALGRPEAARRHRPRHGHGPRADALRRAHQRPRPRAHRRGAQGHEGPRRAAA